MDFMIHGLWKYRLFGHELWITTTHVSLFIIVFLLLLGSYLINRKLDGYAEIPGGIQNAVELVVEKLDGMVDGIMGEDGKSFKNYIGCLFLFLFISNISGIFGLRPPTADYGVTLPLGLITFGMVLYCNVKYNKAKAVTGLFQPIPILFPINLIGEIAAPFSLSLRLFGNVLSGTVLMTLIYGLLPLAAKIGIPAVFHGYFDIFSGAIQAYVFCMLTMVYIKTKIE